MTISHSEDEEIFLYSTIGLGCGCFLIVILILFLLWKANYCNNFICCKRFRLYRELNRHLRQQQEHDRQHRMQQEESALMQAQDQAQDNLESVDLNSTEPVSKFKWCLCCRKCKKRDHNM